MADLIVNPSDHQPNLGQSSSIDVGLYDSVLSGWYGGESNELFKGVPISSSDVVLDVGCGNGGSLLFCARRGAHVIAVDINESSIELMKAKLEGTPATGMDFYASDANPLPLNDATATRVICTEVLEHVDNPSDLMRELVRVGKPGAQYVITVPDTLQEKLQQQVAPPSYFEKPNHIRIFERDEFAKLVADSGLIVEQHVFYGFYWSIWFALFWSCEVDFSNPTHPILENWTRTWQSVLDSKNGMVLKEKLDAFMPKSQVIVARKPA